VLLLLQSLAIKGDLSNDRLSAVNINHEKKRRRRRRRKRKKKKKKTVKIYYPVVYS